MIGSLHGIIELFDGIRIFVNVNGLGYRVHVPQNVLAKYKISQQIDLFVYSHIREDMFDLYGFTDLEDLKLFEAFLGVSGIGPKTALSIFSIGSREQIIAAVQKADARFFTGVPRLGTKNAQKIIIELKNKLGSIVDLDLTVGIETIDKDVAEALKGFGFKDREIYQALKEVGEEKDSGKKLKMALKYLGK